MDEFPSIPRPQAVWIHVIRAAAWDGLLPVAVVAFTFGINTAFPQNHGLMLFTTFCVPVGAALFRANIAYDQLFRVCGNSPGLLRQLGVAAAIVLLFVVEVFASAMMAARDEPADAWLVPAGFYAAYLLTITAALRPVQRPLAEPGSPLTPGI